MFNYYRSSTRIEIPPESTSSLNQISDITDHNGPSQSTGHGKFQESSSNSIHGAIRSHKEKESSHKKKDKNDKKNKKEKKEKKEKEKKHKEHKEHKKRERDSSEDSHSSYRYKERKRERHDR